ncbi:MAG: hypothetical protein LUE14_07745 [Clostridiales bacterium]|nr:hypothetical protein [Clostridiales bacterium]
MSFLDTFTSFAGPGRFAVVLFIFLVCAAAYDILDSQGAKRESRKLKNYAVVVLCLASGMLIIAAVMVLLFLAGLRPGEMADALGGAHAVLVLAVIANITAHRNNKRTEAGKNV